MTTGIHADELLTQSAWVYRLARRLVGDEASADDVAQEVHLQAWSRRGEARPENLRAWLGGMVRNLVRRQRRTAALRRLHERRAADDAPGNAPGEVDGAVARMRLQRALADAVLRLREPYRVAVLHRYLDGRSYDELAREQGISVEAARKRVSRGLALLRRELRYVENGDARALFLVLFGSPAGIDSLWKPLLPLGGLVMGTKLTALLIALAVTALGLGLLAWEGRVGAPATAAIEAAPEPPAKAANLEEVAAAGAERAAAPPREVQAPLGRAAGGSLAAAAGQATPGLELHGRVTDADGRAVAGARVEVRHERFRDLATLDPRRLHTRRRGQRVTTATSDADGAFAVQLEPGKPVDLWVEAAGFPVATATDRYAGERVEVTLQRPAILSGRVTTAEGEPVGGARVTGWKDDASRLVVVDGRTDANGHFRFEDLEPGALRVRVVADGYAPINDSIGTVLTADRSRRLDITVSPGTIVRGTVVDALSGLPVVGAEVGQGRGFLGRVSTDAGGAFELDGFGRDGAGVVRVRAAGYGGASEAVTASGYGELELHFALLPGIGVRGRVVDDAGEPLARAYVAAASVVGDEAGADWTSTETDGQGHFELTDLRIDLDHVLMVAREGYGTELATLDFADVPGDALELSDVVLTGGGEIGGVAVDERGRPLADAQVRLTVMGGQIIGRHVDELSRWNDDPLVMGQRTAGTDGLGRFRFTDLAAGGYEVELSRHPRGAVTVTRLFDGTVATRVELEEGGTVDGLELVLDTKETIAGTILAPDGSPVAGMLVWLFDEAGQDGPGVNQVTGPDGRFAFRGLERGSYSLAAYATSIGVGDAPAPFVDLRRGGIRSGDDDLELLLEPAATVRGVVQLADGLLAAKAFVGAYDEAGQRIELTYTEEDGRFSLNLPPGARVDLLAKPAPTDAPYWDLDATDRMPDERGARRLGVRAGDEGLVLVLPDEGGAR